MDDEISLYFHCKSCMQKKPKNKSPQEWSRIECGWTVKGVKVQCIRCGQKIVHLDFIGQKVDLI